MTKSKALLLAFLTVWPILYIFLFMLFMFLWAASMIGKQAPADLPWYFILIFILHALTMLLWMGIIIYYIWAVFKTPLIPQDKKALWAVVLFMGSTPAHAVYWYLYIWKPLQKNDAGQE